MDYSLIPTFRRSEGATYTKLFGSIVHSTIWREPDHVRLVWITILALADRKGCAWVSIPGLADAARVRLEDCEDALTRLMAPDKYSRSQEYEGRRIAPIDGGFWICNYAKFDAIRNVENRREQVRQNVQRYRDRKRQERQQLELSPDVKSSDEAPAPTKDAPVINSVISVIKSNPLKLIPTQQSLTEQQQGQTHMAHAKKRRASRARDLPRMELFDAAWTTYPHREGSNPRVKALSAWRARVAEGVSEADLLAGVERYARYCEAAQQTGTRFVMQAQRFFGPGREFDNPWDPPAPPKNSRLARRAQNDAALDAYLANPEAAKQKLIDAMPPLTPPTREDHRNGQ